MVYSTEYPDYTVSDILDSYINGQKKQAAVQINYYGTEFWRDFRDYLIDLEYPLSRQLDLYQGIVISYNDNLPHIQGEKV